jgi:hypothetical protein
MGAWDQYYRRGIRADPGTPTGYGVLAIKEELSYNGFAGDIKLDSVGAGLQFDKQVKLFQTSHLLEVDGVVGPKTASILFLKRFKTYELQFHVPDQLVCKLTHLESACDPAAVGVRDPTDLGLVQIHMPAHPSVTVEQAFSSPFSLSFLASGLSNAFSNLKDWDGAIASWNVGGGGAQAWLDAGKPTTLFVSWFRDNEGKLIDLGARATNYVNQVRSQKC